ncbi:hypothetical protein P3T76_014130 [Phytophthora citrophthora]|uniref:MULE transposase domain-containing protein n=1 Tax=Phytophthora citrophthora TaxID=4793 RepID=A0AAD9LCM6_9STRA|nr:hypothetical protein P3T76_014130 [Phytophthora citrophthora]
MKKFIIQQDECGIPPQLILSHLRECPDIVEPKRGYPSLQQVTSCTKYLRQLQRTKNSVHGIKQLVLQNAFNPTGDRDRSFFFGYHEDESGHAYIGHGTDDDSLVVGATNLGLVDACIAFASASNYALFHADATFKLSDLGYPMITCGFTDASRSYQLAAIFVVSRRTWKEYSICLKALVRMIKRVHPSANLHIDAVMGNAEDVQMNGFQQVPEFASSTYLMCF